MSLQQLEHPPPYPDRGASAATSAQHQNGALPAPSSSPSTHQPSVKPAAHAIGSMDRKIILQPISFPPVPHHDPSDARDADVVMGGEEAASLARETSASIENPDDRMAAEALYSLGKGDSNHSTPAAFDSELKYYPSDVGQLQGGSHAREAEPLLSLITSSHPWLGGTLSGSVNAYSSTKSYSPRFIQYGADIVENTVGSVGRRTGVESGLRRYLVARRPSEVDKIDPSLNLSAAKQPRSPIDSAMAVEEEARGQAIGSAPQRSSTRSSVDSLPAYDENKSPAYEEQTPPALPERQLEQRQLVDRRPPRALINRSWSTQLMISTSGLGAALNEASLRSLKFCLNILNGANRHVRNVMDALKQLLEDFSGSTTSLESGTAHDPDAMQLDSRGPRSSESAAIAERIRAANAEIWNTFKTVVDTVSKYTGGALPENASVVVRWQLLSIPRRWQSAVSRAGGNPNDAAAATPSAVAASDTKDPEETVANAHRMIAFAIEGLDMMEQVGGVVDSTINSAERWLESMGRKRADAPQDGEASSSAAAAAAAAPEKSA